jgi:glycosyltransferase involved in cell wall biosynthesis
MCEAFIEAGVDLTLVVPRRSTDPRSVREYYGLRVDVPIIRIPALDWYAGGRVGYLLSSVSFMLSYMYFVWQKKREGEPCILYTVDTDNYSSSALALFGMPLFSEMHGAKHGTPAQHLLFRGVSGIIAINKIIVKELQHTFPHSHSQYLVEPNGVDLSTFVGIDKKEARTRLGLPLDTPIALYTGRFFEWKGLEILPEAASMTPAIRWIMVGGTDEEFARLVQTTVPPNFFFAGSRPHSEMPLWFAAADALVVLGTARDTQSYRYTSPMKLFEYLASGRPIVASSTPAIHEIVSEKEVVFYEPDNARDLAQKVEQAVVGGDGTASRSSAALRLAASSSWKARAERIIRFIDTTRLSEGILNHETV